MRPQSKIERLKRGRASVYNMVVQIKGFKCILLQASAITKGPGVFHNKMRHLTFRQEIRWGSLGWGDNWWGDRMEGLIWGKRLHFQLNEHRLP